MKAEHRKQLQTNALADRVGKLVQTLKTKPQRRTMFYLLLAVAAVAGVVIFFNYQNRKKTEKSLLWVELDNGHPAFIDKLAGIKSTEDYSNTNVGKAARFQYAHFLLWDHGIKAIVASPPRRDEFNPKTNKSEKRPGALGNVERAKSWYGSLLKDCEEDSVWGAEAAYNLAVIEETLAIHDQGNTGKSGHLTKAREGYQKVISKFPKSAQADLAKKKVDLLKEGSPTLTEVSEFYKQLALDLRVDLK
jgi:hypothetical protein